MAPLSSQLYEFLLAVLIGLSIGLFYDLYCAVRNQYRLKKLSGHIWDSIFWIVTTVFTYVSLLMGNWAELRFYVVLGLIAGTVIYTKILGILITPILVKIFEFIGKTLKLIIRIIIYPFMILKKIVLIPLGFIALVFSKLNKIIQKIIWRIFGKPLNLVITRLRKTYYNFKQRIILKLLKILRKK